MEIKGVEAVSKLMTLMVGVLNINIPIVLDSRGGHWTYSPNKQYITGYNYRAGQYAGCLIRFSQLIDRSLKPNLEMQLDQHTPDLTGCWTFDPNIIINTNIMIK